MVFSNEVHLKCRLNEMSKVLYSHRSQTREKTDENAQQIDELLVAEVLIPPFKELFPQFLNFHAIPFRILRPAWLR